MNDILRQALHEKKLNKRAYDEICKWLTEAEFEEFVPELQRLIEANEWNTLMDQFYRTVIFGTAGIRGVMDIGTNRINNYTIRWASQSFAQYLLKYKPDIAGAGVAIAYDSRFHSEEFMQETARVLAANGIPVYIFKYYRATPELSFTVRHLKLAGGIVITASHNPPIFSGYKAYDEHGIQLLPETGQMVEEQFNAVTSIKKMSFDDAVAQNMVRYIGDNVDRAFAEAAKKVSVYPGRDVEIVFSPLHGVGSQSVLPILRELGFNNIHLVEEQMSLDGAFPEVEGYFPNPERAEVYQKPIKLAKKVNADIIIISDPDADRLGVAIKNQQDVWTSLSGNQAAVLMAYFYLDALKTSGRLPVNPVIIKTSVTTELVRDVAESYGVEVIGDLLVGFKFIGDRMEHLPPHKTFLLGCEESVGYLLSNEYRDKGAETPAIVMSEMAAWCKANSTTPIKLLEHIYQQYGYYAERVYYREIEGFGSFDQMNLAMKKLRQNMPHELGGRKVVKVIDRLNGEVHDGQSGDLLEIREWDKGDMLTFFFSEDERSLLHVRPSGTEAKMKYYTVVKGMLSERTKEQLTSEAILIEESIRSTFDRILNSVNVDVF